MLHSTWFQIQITAVFEYQWRPTTIWLICYRKMSSQNWSHLYKMEIFLHKYISLVMQSLGYISECRDSLLKNSQVKYFPGSTIKDRILWDLLKPSIKGMEEPWPLAFIWGYKERLSLTSYPWSAQSDYWLQRSDVIQLHKCLGNTGVKKLMETFIKILTLQRNFWKKIQVFYIVASDYNLYHCNTGMRTTCQLSNNVILNFLTIQLNFISAVKENTTAYPSIKKNPKQKTKKNQHTSPPKNPKPTKTKTKLDRK